MPSHGADNPSVLVVGESPGEQEDQEGIPFVGLSGKLLRETLEATGFDIEREVRFTNAVRCHPPDNKTGKREQKYCQGFMLDDIEQYDPDLVLLMGNTPLNAVLGETGITTWNGVVVERPERIYVPLFHPAYILRNDAVMDDWLTGFINAVDTLDGNYSSRGTRREYLFPETVGDVREMTKYLLSCDMISYDTETTSLDAFDDDAYVIVVSFAGGEHAYAFPLDHPDSWWTDQEYDEILDLMTSLFQKMAGKIVGHNLKFDMIMTWQLLGMDWIIPGGDTMLMSHLIDSRKGIHGLKRLAGLHLGMYDYDKELQDYIDDHPEANPEAGGNYGNIPLEVLMPYAAMDADATLSLESILYKELTEKQRILYHENIMPASAAIGRMEANGIKLDDYICWRYFHVYSRVQSRHYDETIARDPKIQRMTRDIQQQLDDELMQDMLGVDKIDPRTRSLFTAEGEKMIASEDAPLAPRKMRKRKRTVYEFNPNSPDQKRELLFNYYGLDEDAVARTDTGLPSVAAKELKQFRDKYEIVEQLRYYTLLGTMLSRYLGPAHRKEWVSDDGLVHTNYNQHGTTTGRTSSNDPNMQNIPTPEKEPDTLLEILPIKNIFTHRFHGGGLMMIDYSGMELRVFASLAKCEPMLEIHRSGRDFHTMVASMVSGIPYDEIDKATRYVYKWTNWTLLYGGDEHTLYNLYNIPMEEGRRVIRIYFDRFPEVPEYQRYLIQLAKKNGFVESPFGRREYVPYINDWNPKRVAKAKREVVNMPVQSGASETLIIAHNIIDRYFMERGYRSLLINQVHDSLVVDYVPEELEEIVELCQDVMENIVDYAGRFMPNLDMSWLISPLKADAKIGSHYGIEESYK